MSRGLPAFPKKKRGKHFVIRVTMPDGSRPWVKLGENREQAYINFLDYLKQIKSQKSDYSSYRPTINQGIDAFVENTKSRFGEKSKTYQCQDLAYMEEIKERHILDYRDFRRAEKNRSGKSISPTTVNNELDFISTMYTYLIEERNLTLANPIKKIKRLDEPDPDDFYYKPDEVRKILETSKQFSTRNNWHAVFTTFFYTGMRRNELRFLSKKSDRWVFTNSRGNAFSNDTIRQEFRKICKAAELPIKKLHLTRHSWTSIAYEKGVPEPAIQAAGGWSDPKTMRRYNHSGANREYVNKAFQENFSIGE